MKLPVFFTTKMVADSGSYSPSAAKPAQVVTSWLEHGLPITVIEPAPVTVDQLSRAHDREFVTAVLECRESNGFGNRSPEVAATLAYTSGSMLTAARHVLEHGGIASAPCAGFHHAGYRSAQEFCTFNGLMVAACALHHEAGARVGILDFDMHYGDGTDDIIEQLDATWVTHYTAGAFFTKPSQANAFFAQLPNTIESMRDCDVVLYQAGADPHIADPLGGWLTTDELRRRDEIVFDRFTALRIPLAWNLAGGYQRAADGSIPEVLAIHENTARAACAYAHPRR